MVWKQTLSHQKLIDVAEDPRLEIPMLDLIWNTQDALAIEGGVPIKTLNVGSMAHSNW